MSSIITLLTDFGLEDTYVGVMKGVIATIAPNIQIIDLTHAIPPQDVAAARFHLMNAYPVFPPGTVHVAVVDPGVGSQRQAIALQLAEGFLVGPDNGIFSSVLSQHPAVAAVRLDNPAYWRNASPSNTFHGRDIFAPVGTHLAMGVPLTNLGTPIDPTSIHQSGHPTWVMSRTDAETYLDGIVQHIDHFGNVITTIPVTAIPENGWMVEIAQTHIASHLTYAAVAVGESLALVGSHGWIEIAVNGGSAREQLSVQVGDRVRVQC
jgi:S-adenosylmethionine hydrolase